MKIYTKKGDTGLTSLYDGTKITKNNVIIQAVGTLDELNTEIGCILAYYDLNKIDILFENKKFYELLINIQSELFDMGSIIANDPNKINYKIQLFDSSNEFINIIENNIDIMTNKIPKLKNFILPGGNLFISSIHKARTVCRRAETKLTLFKYDHNYFNEESTDLNINNINRCLAYINRLSDYLFTLARFTGHIYNIPEIIYNKTRIITIN